MRVKGDGDAVRLCGSMFDLLPTRTEARTTSGWRWLALVLLLGTLGAGWAAWQRHTAATSLPPGITHTNGRIEAEQMDVSTKIAGRLVEVLVEEGQMVQAGAVVARLDAAIAEAQLRAAEAQLREAEHALTQAGAEIARASSAREFARIEHGRTAELSRRGYAPAEQLDSRRNALDGAEASLRVAEAGHRRAMAAVDTATAVVAQLRLTLEDMVLRAPRSGRVLYRLALPGEVLPAGGRVVTLMDPTDVSMIVFLPAGVAGRLTYGDEARLVLDPAPHYVVPATVSFVSPEAQFTPRQVETAAERESLMFRVKLRLPPELLQRHAERVRGGVRGIGYVRTDPAIAWPASLEIRLP